MKAHIWKTHEDRTLLNLYRDGVSMAAIEGLMPCSRTTIYRRLNALGEVPREPQKRARQKYIVKIIPYDEADSLVKQLFECARDGGFSMTELAERTHLTRETLNNWNRGQRNIILRNLQTLGIVLGKRLIWRDAAF